MRTKYLTSALVGSSDPYKKYNVKSTGYADTGVTTAPEISSLISREDLLGGIETDLLKTQQKNLLSYDDEVEKTLRNTTLGNGTEKPDPGGLGLDAESLKGYAGLAGSLMQAIALPGQMRLAETQEKMLSANLKQFNKDNAFRDTAKANINS